MTDYNAMTDVELDIAVAERVMGMSRAGDYWTQDDELARHIDEWHPSTDHNDAARARERIGEVGSADLFCGYLLGMVLSDPGTPTSLAMWRFINATPRQQCIAALMAVEKGGG